MTAMRRTRAAGHVAVAAGVALNLLAAAAFVGARGPTGGLRGAAPGVTTAEARGAAFRPFVQESGAAQGSATWQLGLVAALGLLMAVTSTPVRAQEAAAPSEPQPDAAATKSRRKRSVRPKVEKPKVEEKDEGFTLSLPSIPSFSVPEGSSTSEVAKKVIISPADQIDDDEKSLGAPNTPLLILLFFGPSFVFLAFYVLGSLDII
mmetsp:Transcript_109177/g.308648  ORF Transcript_109177/g.308648 Transcript_109177/m.308648 type:complete len:205 (-) Transcript_109177:65-679(-)